MIKQISIKNIGSLKDFNNNEVPFKRGNNIIHGMNGSGKSQITTVLNKVAKLKSIEQSETSEKNTKIKEIKDFLSKRKSRESSNEENIEVKIDNFNLTINTKNDELNYSETVPNIFVFNKDYVEKNVSDIVHLPEKEIRIGEKNIVRDKLLGEIKETEKALDKVNKEIDTLVKNTRIESGYSNQTRTNKIISVDNYLSQKNPGEKNKDARRILDGLANLPEPIKFHLSIKSPAFPLSSVDREELEYIFSNPFIEPKLTQEFYKKYISVSKKFYEKGIDIFKKENKKCPFCLTPKESDDSNINELIDYIDSTYNDKLRFLEECYKKLEKHGQDINNYLKQWNSHISTLNEKAELLNIDKIIKELTFNFEKYDEYLKVVKNKIDDMSLLSDNMELEEPIYISFENLYNQFQKNLDNHKLFIEEINEERENVSSKKQKLGEQIIKHHMYELWNKNNLRDRKNELEVELKNKNEKYEELSDSISNDRTIDFFNQIIRFLGINKYELNDTSSIILKIDKNYDISNEGFRISTGEKKFIAMSYFFAEVLASVKNSSDLDKISLIIDDPIDSSDYQRFYSFISVVEKFNNILQTIYRNDNIKLGQIILFTHNALLYERLISSQTGHHFLLKLEDNQTKIFQPNNKVSLTSFSTYLQKITKQIKEMRETNDEEIGNYIRRILEILASIENIDNNKIVGLNSSSKLNALANHLSHESLERMIDPLPESHEYIEACIQLIEEIKKRIPALYDTIIKKYLDNKEIVEYRMKYEEIYQNR